VLGFLLACACPARADPSPALDAGVVKEAVRQLQALAVEKEGLDAWSEALAGTTRLTASKFQKSPYSRKISLLAVGVGIHR
jgi:hypothetical protein